MGMWSGDEGGDLLERVTDVCDYPRFRGGLIVDGGQAWGVKGAAMPKVRVLDG